MLHAQLHQGLETDRRLRIQISKVIWNLVFQVASQASTCRSKFRSQKWSQPVDGAEELSELTLGPRRRKQLQRLDLLRVWCQTVTSRDRTKQLQTVLQQLALRMLEAEAALCCNPEHVGQTCKMPHQIHVCGRLSRCQLLVELLQLVRRPRPGRIPLEPNLLHLLRVQRRRKLGLQARRRGKHTDCGSRLDQHVSVIWGAHVDL